MIVELEGATPIERAPSPGTFARVGVALGLALAVILVAGHDGLGARPLALPVGIADVEIVVFPDSLTNDPPDPRLTLVVAVRGTIGLATPWLQPQRGMLLGPGTRTTLTWSEGGIAYTLSSARRQVSDLVRIADSLR